MKKTLLLICFMTLCNLVLLAQTATVQSPIIHVPEKSSVRVPAQEIPEGSKVIFSNLGSKTDLYDDLDGWPVSGPASAYGASYEEALPFTPKSNSHVTQVGVPLFYAGSGANQVIISIFGDSDGFPGTLLAGPVTVTNLQTFGSCCLLAVANFSSTAVTGGTRYWVVASAPTTGTGSDFSGVWCGVSKPVITMAGNSGSGWFAYNADQLLAGEVLGTIP